ncbi:MULTISPECIES: phytoene/squalene synthase family protein [Amycolatopsis]|uniref:Phytoene/squalene synthase family protein n=1 Tax=Amycolatopsis albidoflavus TaxID=102226 RepID=A0ABW5I954_9PSEU
MSELSEPDRWYAVCEEITRASAKNFWWGIRLLDPGKRRALAAVYACARRADDIADGDLPDVDKLAELARLRAALADPARATGDPVLLAVFDAARSRPIPLLAFEELLDGCAADVLGIRYETWDETEHYCRQVAGSIGRLSLGVFGSEALAAPALANSLGIALQLTNILRDVLEDRRQGRVYLPAIVLREHDVKLDLDAAGALTDPPEHLAVLYRETIARAEGHFETGLQLIPLLDRRSAWCCGALVGIYQELLRLIKADPAGACRARVSVPDLAKLRVVARAFRAF